MEALSDERPSTPRRLIAVTLATLCGVIAYWAVVVAVAAVSDTGSFDGTTGIAVGVGFVLLPVGFLILSWMSRHESVLRAVVTASAAAVVIWTWTPFLFGEVVSPFAAAFGLGGAIALRADAPQRLRNRLVAVLLVAVYVFVVVRLAFGFGLLVAPFLPLPAVLAADFVSERRAA